MTNPGPWEPHAFYDADDSLEILPNPTSIMYHPYFSSTTDHNDHTYAIKPKTLIPDEDDLYYFDPMDNISEWQRCSKAFHLSINYTMFTHMHRLMTSSPDLMIANSLDTTNLLIL